MHEHTSILSNSTLRDEFINGASRAFFIAAYADCHDDEKGSFDGSWPVAFDTDSRDWNDLDIAIPANAYVLAGELWSALEYENRCSVYALTCRARKAEQEDGTIRPRCPLDHEIFGWCLAMTAMGHGVSWFDNHATFEITIPNMEVSFMSFDWDRYDPIPGAS